MTTEAVPTQSLDPAQKLRADDDRMRRLFEEFSVLKGDAKKEMAREIMKQLQVQPTT